MTATLQPTAVGSALWQIDPAHTNVQFAVKHLMISTVKGWFSEFSGEVRVPNGDFGSASIDVTIEAASIDTRIEARNQHLRSADFFEVERFPTLSFRSSAVERVSDDEYRVTGDLTIRDVTRPVVLAVSAEGGITDPDGAERAAFSASTKINRKDFGLTWNQALETGGVLVGEEVKISLDVQLVRQ